MGGWERHRGYDRASAVQLIRFALISLDGAADDWTAFTVEHDGVIASAIQSWSKPPGLLILVAASVALDEPPVSDSWGVVEVPDTPRRQAEAAIEVAANAVSIATGHRRTLVARVTSGVQVGEHRRANMALCTVHAGNSRKGTAAGRVLVKLDEQDINALADRDAEVALMAEVLEQRHETARLRIFFLLFEQAFASSPGRLVKPLAEFLAKRPGLDYTKAEVKSWITHYRGRAMHADRRPPLSEADVRPIIDRVLLAGYEVLINKMTWGTADVGRRDAWTPISGPLDRDGRWFLLQHSAPTVVGQIFDVFNAYIVSVKRGPVLALDAACWPRQSPTKINAPQAPVEVVPAERLAVIGERPSGRQMASVRSR